MSQPERNLTNPLSTPLKLPCGVTLPNRLCKAAMSELVADTHNRATHAHAELYRAWARNGPGLLLTGNVQIDRRHLEHPGNVVIDGAQDAERLAALRVWATAAKSGGGHVWMQLAHAGRQTHRYVNSAPKAPSAAPLALPGVKFGTPTPLTGAEIIDLVDRFAQASAVAREAGFDGVQLHAAHGYLFSQFLSPRSNLRHDEWGGDLAHRARFLLETVKAMRAKVGPDYPIAVKLNSADFQRGGFSFEDSQTVAGWLDEASVDLIEISGGTYEQPTMSNIAGTEERVEPTLSRASRDRESYFARFAPEIRARLKRTRLMVTGGFRTARGMADAIAQDGVDMVGLGRPLCLDPDAPSALLAGADLKLKQPETLRLGPGLLGPKSPVKLLRAINGLGSVTWYNEQILRLAAGGRPDPKLPFLPAFLRSQARDKHMAARMNTGPD